MDDESTGFVWIILSLLITGTCDILWAGQGISGTFQHLIRRLLLMGQKKLLAMILICLVNFTDEPVGSSQDRKG